MPRLRAAAMLRPFFIGAFIYLEHRLAPLPAVFEWAGFIVGHLFEDGFFKVDMLAFAEVHNPDYDVGQFGGYAIGFSVWLVIDFIEVVFGAVFFVSFGELRMHKGDNITEGFFAAFAMEAVLEGILVGPFLKFFD